ncbi:MAG: FAD-dependent oxidoreductase [Planctomycetaceae bacterium]|nr:FAD-dependent oxidoreductase [Planctomycetaceae bacterium]
MIRILPIVMLLLGPRCGAAEKIEADVVVYGGTSAGVIAAVQAKTMGRSVVIVGPDRHLGGLSSGGLGWTDTGRKEVIGGLARDFYHRIWKKYQQPATWKFQRAEDYGGRGQGTPAVDGANRTMWIFEPRVAEKVFHDYVREFDIPVYRDEWLNRQAGVEKTDGRLQSITMLSGKTFVGKMFIDATYEGDLMATAGITYHVGRESSEVYGEDWNGVQTGVLHHRHHFDAIPKKTRIDPYVVPGDPSSGVIAGVSADPPGKKRAGDHRVQAYCFRMCLTNDPENRIPFQKPENYDAANYELLGRILDAGWRDVFGKFDPIPNHKTDTNNHGPMSTDNIGRNYDYPEATYEQRRAIIRQHEQYQQGWLWYLSHDPRVPADIREKMQTWGLPKDEFADNGHWSHQLYIREARRMVGHFVMTENELLQKRPTPQSVGMGSYTIDSHNVQRYITADGYVQNEGDIGVKCRPYQIAYGSMIPRRTECTNLLVPVCVSSSHIAFGSIRMEPVFMILGQSAATAAVMAIDADQHVQDVDYDALRQRLLDDGQVLSYEVRASGQGVDPAKLPGVVVDNEAAVHTGKWTKSSSVGPYVAHGYEHNGGNKAGDASVTFVATLPTPGRFECRLAYTPNPNRASRVAVIVEHADGRKQITIDQRKVPPVDGLFLSLGTFRFEATGRVIVTTEGADGYVIADAVQWLPQN